MEIDEVLEFVDEVVFTKTGKHLNDLQRGVIEGTLKRQKYNDIAESYGCSAGHAKDVGYELLQLLSKIFDEPVSRKNLKSVLERQGNQNICFGDNNILGYINICPDRPTSTLDKNPSETNNIKSQNTNKTQIETINKLRQFGLSDEQIAEALEIPFDLVNRVSLEE